MSWEYLCEVCGKSVFSDSDWRGMHVLCEDCQALADEEEESQDRRGIDGNLKFDKMVDIDIEFQEHGV